MTTGLILHTGGHCPHPVPLGVGPLGSVTRAVALGRIRLFPGTPVLRGGAEPWWRAGTCPSPPRASWEMPPTRGLCQLPVRGGRWVSRRPGAPRSRTMLPPCPRRAGRLLGTFRGPGKAFSISTAQTLSLEQNRPHAHQPPGRKRTPLPPHRQRQRQRPPRAGRVAGAVALGTSTAAAAAARPVRAASLSAGPTAFQKCVGPSGFLPPRRRFPPLVRRHVSLPPSAKIIGN
ncbi:uncharacterized protein LOC111728893 isoform X2 [Pteropus vampyrus]|uniref:Uncharacterized protein LOC111728893 isoform X2 n=1 Tax=Pteropus vampyrus TaxID=132908 RepID=A0A6P6BKD4_PTEVA|nr:uncharacterized protein LOC111728893 isoform X2 [Pteropus vampyrus]